MGFGTVRILYFRDTGKEGIQKIWDTGLEGFRTRGLREKRVQTGGMWNRRDAGQEGYERWDKGQLGCRTREI